MVNPTEVRIGVGSAAQTRKRYHGTPRSERSYPKTSHATANSKGAIPLPTTTATVCPRLAGSLRIGSILPLVDSHHKPQDGFMFDPTAGSAALAAHDRQNRLLDEADIR